MRPFSIEKSAVEQQLLEPAFMHGLDDLAAELLDQVAALEVPAVDTDALLAELSTDLGALLIELQQLTERSFSRL